MQGTPRLMHDIAYLCTKFEDSSFHIPKIQTRPKRKNK